MALFKLPVGRTLAAALAAAALSLAPAAGAQPSSPGGASERALELGHEGLRLFRQGSFADAYERFAAADRLAHSPVLVLFMARSRRGAGDLVAARDLLRRVANEPLPPDAAAPWKQAQADAARELREVEARVPSVRVVVRGAAGATLVVDGAVVPPDVASAPIALDAGKHTFEARAPDGRVVTREVTLVEGAGTTAVDLTFAVAALAAPLARAPEGPRTPADEAGSPSLVPGLVAIGVGAVGLGVGTAFGLMARSDADEVLEGCEGTHCLASDRDKGEGAERFATISTIGFVSAAIAIPVGAALIVLRPFDRGAASVSARVGPGSLAVTGRF
jgi:hypothetical protein